MSAIKTKAIKQMVIGGATQPLKIGGVLDDGSDAIISIDQYGNATGMGKDYPATLPYTSWTGASAPYTKVVNISGIKSTDTPILDVDLTGVYATDQSIIDNWANVYRADSSDGAITFYAKSVPTVDIPFVAKVIR